MKFDKSDSQAMYEALLRIIPDLPDKCISINLNLKVGKIPTVKVKYFPSLVDGPRTMTTTFSLTPNKKSSATEGPTPQ